MCSLFDVIVVVQMIHQGTQQLICCMWLSNLLPLWQCGPPSYITTCRPFSSAAQIETGHDCQCIWWVQYTNLKCIWGDAWTHFPLKWDDVASNWSKSNGMNQCHFGWPKNQLRFTNIHANDTSRQATTELLHVAIQSLGFVTMWAPVFYNDVQILFICGSNWN